MNVNLQPGTIDMFSVSEPDTLEGWVVEQQTTVQARHLPDLPSIDYLLRRIGPLPREALLMGLAEDGLPVLLNVWDPKPGPILVAGDSGSGKTGFLKLLAGFVHASRQPGEIQYGVLTEYPHEWYSHAKFAHCIGIFSTRQQNGAEFIQALTIWIDMTRTSRQSILLLMDGLEDIADWDVRTKQNFHKILLHGPAKGIWPVVTVDPGKGQNVRPWLKYFRTRVFGHTHHASAIDEEADHFAGCEALTQGKEFCLRVAARWIRFGIPIM